MDTPDDNRKPQDAASGPPEREIRNADLFAEEIVFSDTEKVLFEEDFHDPVDQTARKLLTDSPGERYTPSRKINEGGMKAIWSVDDHRTARKVAMALIQDARIASTEDIDAFLYEARLTANLQHPNIVPIYDIALDENGNPYFTMKALKGETLAHILAKLRNKDPDYGQRFPLTRLLSVFVKVCNAIEYAHTKGVIHLDLKPANVMVGDFGEVQVLDWGLSTLLTRSDASDHPASDWQSMDQVPLENGQSLTRYLEHTARQRDRNRVVGGTPGYMAPEQARGDPADIDFQTDVYMLGSLLYEILTCRCPLEGSTVKEVMQKTVRGELVPPAERVPGRRIPSALNAVTMRAMQTEPADRYPNVAAMIQDIQKFQDGYATWAENPTFITHLVLLIKRHKLAAGLIAASACIISLILAQSFISVKKSERVALDALASLQERNAYIARTARQVAPDYLELMAELEQDYKFQEAEQALDTGLAFDPSLATGWMWKAKMLMCRLRFDEAWTILSGNHDHPVQQDAAALQLASTYRGVTDFPDSDMARLALEFRRHNIEGGLPRLFYYFNQRAFEPGTHFPALTQALQNLNPGVDQLDLRWSPAANGGWMIDLSNQPALENITPLCGLRIHTLKAHNTGVTDLSLITEPTVRTLDVSNTPLNHLFELEPLEDLRKLNISGTRIRNLSNLVQYPQLETLNISGIEGLSISPQLLWCRQLRILTVSEAFRTDPTIQSLARRGVIILYEAD